MTQHQKNIFDYIKMYVPLLSVFILFFYMGVWTAKSESRIFESPKEKENVISHVEDFDLHMPYSQKVKEFVPRTEIETMKDDIKEIKADVKSLIKDAKER